MARGRLIAPETVETEVLRASLTRAVEAISSDELIRGGVLGHR